jgi:uncharacterized protein YjcR
MAKTTPWNKIKKEYLDGVPVKELAIKYKIKARSISDKAYEEDWKEEKTRIAENIRDDVQSRIKELTNLALDTLKNVINDPEAKHTDKVSASKALLDVSGLKSVKQEVSGIQGTSVVINREAVLVESNN